MFPWKLTKKTIPVIIIFCAAIILYSLFSVTVNWEFNATFDYECRKNGSEPLPKLLHYCIRGPRIFFTETSGSRYLTARQACAVESTARNNPSLGITVLLTCPLQTDFTHELMEQLSKLPNVVFRAVDIDVFVHGTPIWEWLRLGKWKKSKWKVSHLSDALRFLVVWKYGGMYLDLDIVTLRSLEHLQNSVITENWDRIASGILIFDRGHELMRKSMIDFALHYDSNNFAFNGPGVISRNIREFCDIQDISKISGAGCDVDILPPEAAFPIAWDEWEKYFEPSDTKNISAYFSSSYMIHVWNKYSKEGKIHIGHNSLYEQAIKEHCPIVYRYAQKVKYI